MSKISNRGRWAVFLGTALLVASFFYHRRSAPPDPGAKNTTVAAAKISTPANSLNEYATEPPGVPADSREVLFAWMQPANAAILDAALPAPTRAIHYLRLNAALIAGKSSPFWQRSGVGRLQVPLPDGTALTVVIESSEMLGPDRFTSVGHIEGRPHGRAIFAYNEGFLHASIEDPELGNYALRTATDTLSQFYRIDPALVPPCGGERRPIIDARTLAAAEVRRARQAELAAGVSAAAIPATAAAENPQHAEVHVMMVYTQAVMGGIPDLSAASRAVALQSAFDAAIAKVNDTFAASLITARVKLVNVLETQYDETRSVSNRVQDDALTALEKTDDGKMDEIHAVRDQAGADVVCLALGRSDTASIGLSFVLDTPGETANAQFAFSVVQYTSIAGSNVVPHELGHIFGCVHDRQNADGPGAYSYSYGYRFTGADGRQYHDIMSYPPGTELGYFSNPDVIVPPPVNARIGVAPGSPGEADTGLTIEKDAFEVSTYRLQTLAAPNAGALINVATRAYVGAGDQVLIGGFVVNGSQSKKILARAAGPALAVFGVPNALPDPVLRLFSGTTKIAENDNWMIQAAGTASSEIASAASQVGAFPFGMGSTDSALLVTLAPGAYSAVVEGALGATGSGLVEVYEVDHPASKIVNLSTRGYADRQGKDMIGGFVVQGEAGSTKRILIRVLGPTLGRFNVSGPMEDPFMEVHNGAGDLLIQNDDWSTGTSVGPANPVNDFSPLVESYNEKQIFATGFAPANRREPCVMVDLPPGSYTVVAKPFEFLPTDPARPGVALVEVYEINP